MKQGLLKLSGLASDFSPPALVSGEGWIYRHGPPHPFRHIFLLLTGSLGYSSSFFSYFLTWSLPLGLAFVPPDSPLLNSDLMQTGVASWIGNCLASFWQELCLGDCGWRKDLSEGLYFFFTENAFLLTHWKP